MLSVDDRITGTVQTLAFGGEGILRHEGQVVFVPFTAIGDVVEVEVREIKKSFARAKLLRVLESSKERIAAPCQHFATCGGCQLQHLEYASQLKAKHEWVEQALKRIGGLDLKVQPVIGAQDQWGYRRVVKLRFGADLKLSYVNAESNGQVAIESCPIFSSNTQLWSDLNAFLHTLLEGAHCSGQLTLYRADNENYVAFVKSEGSEKVEARVELPASVKGCLIKSAGRTRSVGDVNLGFEQHGLTFSYTPLCFVQNHAEQSAKISAQVIELVVASGAKEVLDLYCGFGISAIALAKKGMNVTAIESNPESIRMAKLNAKKNSAHVEWVCDDVTKVLKSALKKRPGAIIVNPPRTGLAPSVAKTLATSRVPQIVYVSCMPQTLARDLKVICEAGYKVAECQPYDMFPQTTHVETVVSLKLR